MNKDKISLDEVTAVMDVTLEICELLSKYMAERNLQIWDVLSVTSCITGIVFYCTAINAGPQFLDGAPDINTKQTKQFLALVVEMMHKAEEDETPDEDQSVRIRKLISAIQALEAHFEVEMQNVPRPHETQH